MVLDWLYSILFLPGPAQLTLSGVVQFQLFDFADKYRGKYDSSITVAQKYYRSISGYNVIFCFIIVFIDSPLYVKVEQIQNFPINWVLVIERSGWIALGCCLALPSI